MSTAKTKPQSTADLWSLVARSRLYEPSQLAALQAAFATASAGKPQDAAAAVQWLGSQKQLTAWQARRLLRGDAGPFMIGDYRLLDRIDSPTGAILLRALHVPSSKPVVIAMLDRARCKDLETWTAIVRRTAIAHHMADPMFSKTWALEQVDGNRIIVCEDVAGQTLYNELAKRGGLPVQEAGWITLSLARAVAEHQRVAGVHGGISLDSLRRDPQSSGVRLLQYPLVGDPHAAPPRIPLENPDVVSKMGTSVAFLPPECILSGGVLDEASDVYAIGCVLAALITGSVPGWKQTAEATLASAAIGGLEPPGPPEVPIEVGALIGYLTSRDPAQRYPNAADAASAIAACFGFPAVASVEPPSPVVGEAFPAAARPEPAATPVRVEAGPIGAAAGDATTRARRRAAIFRASVAGLAAILLGGVVSVALFWDSKPSPDANTNSPGRKIPSVAVKPPSDEPDFDEADESDDNESDDMAEQPATPAPKVVRVNDSEAVWDAPTHAGPPALDYLPPGSQVVLIVRPAEMLAAPEGDRFLKALGPAAESAIREASSLCGCDPSGIERIVAGWQVDAKGGTLAAFAFELREPLDAEKPPASWKSTTKLSMNLPKSRGGKLLVAAPPDLLAIMLETDGVPQLTPDMQRLAEHLDARRHVVLMGSPAFLENDGRDMLTGPLGRIAEPAARFFGPDVLAAAVSLHFGEKSSYAELLAVPPRDVQPVALAERLAKAVVSLPGTVEEYVTSLDLHPYGRKLVSRLPSMVRSLEANLRRGAEDSIAIVNCHLPPTAPHNIALASEIALEQRPGAAVAATGGAGRGGAKGAAEALAMKMSLSFPRDSLDRTMQAISEEVGVPIEILGGDLQLKGITQNQSFGLDERDQPVDAILRTILQKANPDGHLVYVIRKKDGVESIVITTRDACESRGETIPEVFRKKP